MTKFTGLISPLLKRRRAEIMSVKKLIGKLQVHTYKDTGPVLKDLWQIDHCYPARCNSIFA